MVATSSSRDGLRRPGRPRGSRGLTVVRHGGSGRRGASIDSSDRLAFAHRRPSCRLGRRARGSPSSSACPCRLLFQWILICYLVCLFSFFVRLVFADIVD